MSTQPEALLLAECLEQHEHCTHGQMDRAAAELRRLHAEIERLTAAWHCQHVRKVEERAEAKLWFEHAQKLHAVNAELLAALRTAADHLEGMPDPEDVAACVAKVRAAIEKAEGK